MYSCLRVTHPAPCAALQESEEAFDVLPGDYVRFPKWLLAELEFSGKYEQLYRFRAYGDD